MNHFLLAFFVETGATLVSTCSLPTYVFKARIAFLIIRQAYVGQVVLLLFTWDLKYM